MRAVLTMRDHRGRRPKAPRQRVRADDLGGRHHRLLRRAVLDRHEAELGRRCFRRVRRRHANVVAFHAQLAACRGVAHVDPALDVGVPQVGGLAQEGGFLGLVIAIGEVGRGQESGDARRQRERRIARVFFPAIFLGDGPVAGDEAGRALYHRPAAALVVPPQRASPQQHFHLHDL